MTTEDFKVIADVIRDCPVIYRNPLMLMFSFKLEEKYPNFDPDKFREYVEQ